MRNLKTPQTFLENILKLELQIEEVKNSDICSYHKETYHLTEITWALMGGCLTDVGILLFDHFWKKYYDSGLNYWSMNGVNTNGVINNL